MQVNVGVVSAAGSTTTVSTVTGAQTYAGSGVGASSATAASSPAGTQNYIGAVSGASSATTSGFLAGTQNYVGSVASAASATTAGTVSGSFAAQSVVGGKGQRISWNAYMEALREADADLDNDEAVIVSSIMACLLETT